MKDSSCTACGYYGIVDQCHIKSKGSGGTMDESNIILFCRGCHSTQHRIGWGALIKRFPHIAKTLDEKGWQMVNEFGRNKLMRKE